MQLSDELVKSVFDNIKNFVLSSVVIAISVIILRDNCAGNGYIYQYIIGSITFLAGIGLFAFTLSDAWKKIDSVISCLWIKLPALIIYALVAIEFIRVLWVMKMDL